MPAACACCGHPRIVAFITFSAIVRLPGSRRVDCLSTYRRAYMGVHHVHHCCSMVLMSIGMFFIQLAARPGMKDEARARAPAPWRNGSASLLAGGRTVVSGSCRRMVVGDEMCRRSLVCSRRRRDEPGERTMTDDDAIVGQSFLPPYRACILLAVVAGIVKACDGSAWCALTSFAMSGGVVNVFFWMRCWCCGSWRGT